MSRTCTTHHHACDCREARFKKLKEAHDHLLSGLRSCTMPAGGVVNAVVNRKAQCAVDYWEQHYKQALAALEDDNGQG